MTKPDASTTTATDGPNDIRTGSVTLHLRSEATTNALASWFADQVGVADVLLLDGPIGAGKTAFARQLIQTLLDRHGLIEDVPSPTFTLVQTYVAGPMEIWHADLYRLNSPAEVEELGLPDAFDTALCLVEWPDRLGELRPKQALTLRFSVLSDTERVVTISGAARRWSPILTDLADWSSDDG